MARKNQGPRLRWLEKRKRFYVTWTERGRSYEMSTSTADREDAEAFFAHFMRSNPALSENVRGMSAPEPPPAPPEKQLEQPGPNLEPSSKRTGSSQRAENRTSECPRKIVYFV